MTGLACKGSHIDAGPRGIPGTELTIFNHDIMAKIELKLGGVFDFEEYTAPLRGPLLPRTAAQKATLLASLKKRLADPDEHININNPQREITRTLTQIELQRAELKRLDALWAQYAKSLKELGKSK